MHHGHDAKCRRRSEGRQRPTTQKWRNDADNRRGRFTHTDLVTPVFVIAQRSEVGVITGPVKHIADRGHDAQRVQHAVHPLHVREQRILRGHQQCASDHERPQAKTNAERQDERPQQKTTRENSRQRNQYTRCRYTGAQQKDAEKHAACAGRERMHGVMQVEQIDSGVAQKGHGVLRRVLRSRRRLPRSGARDPRSRAASIDCTSRLAEVEKDYARCQQQHQHQIQHQSQRLTSPARHLLRLCFKKPSRRHARAPKPGLKPPSRVDK